MGLHCLVSSDCRSSKIFFIFKTQGPDVQSIVSLTSSLRGQLVKCRVSTVREKVREKSIFSRSGNFEICQGILEYKQKSGNFALLKLWTP